MPYKEDQPRFMGGFAWIFLKNVVKKPLFGSRYLLPLDYIGAATWQYESGAIIGRARRNKLDILEKMLVTPNETEGKVIKAVQADAKKLLNDYRGEKGKEPRIFMNFVMSIIAAELDFIKIFDADSNTGHQLMEAITSGDRKRLREYVKLAKKKIPLEYAIDNLVWFGMEGIGFGSTFLELTEKMYRNAYENIDMDEWSFAREHGLDIPEKPDMLSLEEREQSALQTLAAYAAEFYPELLDPLDLRGCLDVILRDC
jgi:hypothetical protein